MTQLLTTSDAETSTAIVVGDELVSTSSIAQGRGGGDPELEIRSALDCLLAFAQSELGFEETASLAIDALFQANLRMPAAR